MISMSGVPYGKIIITTVPDEDRQDDILPLFLENGEIIFIYDLDTNHPKITSEQDYYFVSEILSKEWTGQTKDINDIEEWKRSIVIKKILERRG